MSSRLGRDPFAGDAPAVEVVLARTGDQYTAELRLQTAGGVDSTTELRSDAGDCAELFSATVLAVTVALDGEASTNDASAAKAMVASESHEKPRDEAAVPVLSREPGTAPEADRPRPPAEPRAASGGYSNWLGLELAQDLAILRGQDAACSPAASNEHFSCFEGDESTPTLTHGDSAGRISGGYVPATRRLLGVYERALMERFGILLRAGFAFGDTADQGGDYSFFPAHGELNAVYRFGGHVPYAKRGFGGFLFAGGGVAQVDTSVDVSVIECETPDCTEAPSNPRPRRVTAYKHMGMAFASAGVGATWRFADRVGAYIRLGGLYMFPAEGFVVQPSVGLSTGL